MKRLVGVALFLTLGGAAMATEEATYEVVRTYDEFELRRYASYLVAEIEVEGDFAAAGNLAFRTLFRYISGENQAAQSIAMTAPVTQAPAGTGQKIAMTAPVTQVPVAGAETRRHAIGFVMPAAFTLDTLPRPNDPRVRIREVASRLVAAHRYSGTWSEERYREHEKTLLEAVVREGLQPVGTPIFARYNSPFAVWFMRRNEVLVDIVDTAKR